MALGDIIYRGASLWLRLVGNTTTTKKFLRQTGTGSVSAAPAWDTVALDDLSDVAIAAPATDDVLVYNGSTWVNEPVPSGSPGSPGGASGPVWWPEFTAPVNGDFAWINQGGASVDAVADQIYILSPASGTSGFRIRKKSAPSTPYTITTALVPFSLDTTGWACNIGWRQSSDGKFIFFGFERAAGATQLAVYKFTNETTFSASYTTIPMIHWAPIFLQITDNGTNRICKWSRDGRHFHQLHTIGRTDFLTGNEVLFAVNTNATYDTAMTLLSWEET